MATRKPAGGKPATRPGKRPSRHAPANPPAATTAAADEVDLAKIGDASIPQIVDWVGDDTERSAAALAAEQARGDDARSTLLERLQAPAQSPDPDAENATVENVPVVDAAPTTGRRRVRHGRNIADRDIYDNGGLRGGRRLVARKGQVIPTWYRGD